jgi:Short C-terminal domain/Phospholipase_D-nuclease N-terminal
MVDLRFNRDPNLKEKSVLAAYSFGDVMWTMFVFFAWIIFFWLLFTVFGDLFSRHDISGWAKTGWVILVLVLPYLGIFIYLIANGKSMGERAMQRAQSQQSQMDDYVRSVASDSSADQIAKGKQLLDSGAITQAEFDQLKAKALGT